MLSSVLSNGESNLYTTFYWQITTIQQLKIWCNFHHKGTIWRNSRTFHSSGRTRTISWRWSPILLSPYTRVTSPGISTSQTRMILSWSILLSSKRLQSPTTEHWCKAVAWKVLRTWREQLNNNKQEIEHRNWQFRYKINWWKSLDNVKCTWWRKL